MDLLMKIDLLNSIVNESTNKSSLGPHPELENQFIFTYHEARLN